MRDYFGREVEAGDDVFIDESAATFKVLNLDEETRIAELSFLDKNIKLPFSHRFIKAKAQPCEIIWPVI